MGLRRWVSLLQLVVVLGVVCGCTGCSRDTGERASASAQAFSGELVLTFPAGVGRLDAVLNASNSVVVGDRVQVLDNGSRAGAVSNSGSGQTSVGVEASVGRLVSVGPVHLRSRSVVGDILSSTAITKQSDAKVRGAEASHATLAPLTTLAFPLSFPETELQDVEVEPDETRTLSPGDYADLVVKPRATLVLGNGEYTFRRFDVQADGTAFVGDGAKIAVRDELLLKGAAWNYAGGALTPADPPVWNIVYAGGSEVGINSSFHGSLVAPRAKITLAAKDHTGWFYAADIDVQAGASVRARPGTQVCIPSHGCETIPDPPASVRLPLPSPIPTVAPSEVGAVDWTFAVTPSGKASYSVPIEVPPGPGGIVPELTLSYTSVQAMGIAGMGWSIGGFSSISRCPKTSGTDRAPAPIADTSFDRFCLDGQALFEHDGGYRTELETFRRIKPAGPQGAPVSFEVEGKDGRILEYGGAGATDLHNGVIRTWALRKVRDRSGNALTISYMRACARDTCPGDLALVPERIDYGENAKNDLAGDRSVRFEYEARPDARDGWQRGSLRGLLVRLKRISSHPPAYRLERR